MVYGRYNQLVNGGYFMVYKPTFTSLGGPILYAFWASRAPHMARAAHLSGHKFLESQIMYSYQWEFQEPIDWRYLPYM